MKNKLLTILLIILVAVTLVGVASVAAIAYFKNDHVKVEKEPSIDEIIKTAVNVPEITTNLANGDFVRMTLTIQTDSKKAKIELEKRDFQVKNLLITELSELKSDMLQSKAGKEQFQDRMKTKLNEIMQEGKIEKVYITSSILQ
ncbi:MULTISPECIES: flagellar basal body-associated protein FliL [Bacillaceae]|uniref:Flagellar protein FliL n=1 Tax=Peribacillus huizhouensis TaxID=1501239 RepID=A0ABR6CJH5_9BACI|nr:MULTISPECIES: flagellar basal body-associated protein FliL [Bacillaceae]MBA9024861.1 flagellar FliL protein [Peribacillus huizhouensis]